MHHVCYICGCVCISVEKLINHQKNNKCTVENFVSSLNALQNEARPDPTNYNDISDNGPNNSVDDPMDITDSIGYVETMEDYMNAADATDATENDENINYDEQGIFYWN